MKQQFRCTIFLRTYRPQQGFRVIDQTSQSLFRRTVRSTRDHSSLTSAMSTNYTFQGWLGLDKNSANGKMIWKQYEPKPFEETDVDIKITHCGICGSDIHTLRSGWSTADYPVCKYSLELLLLSLTLQASVNIDRFYNLLPFVNRMPCNQFYAKMSGMVAGRCMDAWRSSHKDVVKARPHAVQAPEYAALRLFPRSRFLHTLLFVRLLKNA